MRRFCGSKCSIEKSYEDIPYNLTLNTEKTVTYVFIAVLLQETLSFLEQTTDY